MPARDQTSSLLARQHIQYEDPFAKFAQYANQKGAQIRADERYADEQARQKILDARDTERFERQKKEWADIDAEKQKQEYARQLLANFAPTADVIENKAYQEAVKKWDMGGRVGEAPVIQNFPVTTGKGVDITAATPSLGSTMGAPIYGVRSVQAETTPASTTTTSVSKPSQKDTSKKEVVPNVSAPALLPSANTAVEGKDYTLRPWDAVVATNKKVGEFLLKGITEVVGPGVNQVRSALLGGGKQVPQDRVLSPEELNPKAPLVPVTATAKIPTPVEKKAAQAVNPKTAAQKESAKTQVRTTMEKVITGYKEGIPPKMTQIDGAVLDKIMEQVDPRASSREEAKSELTSMLFALGLSPKEVKEYADMGVEAAYGSANDPIKLALAQTKANAYLSNVERVDKNAMDLYKLREEARQFNARLSQSESQFNRKLAADMRNSKAVEDSFLKAMKSAAGGGYGKHITPEGQIAFEKSIEELLKAQYENSDKGGFWGMGGKSFNEYKKENETRLRKLLAENAEAALKGIPQ